MAPFTRFHVLALLLILSGCTRGWNAQTHLFRAEGAYDKAHEMRKKSGTSSQRLKLYQTACDEFAKAYETDTSAFTLLRIEMASDACFRVGDLDRREMFLEFEEIYVEEHPDEVRYGDAFPALEA